MASFRPSEESETLNAAFASLTLKARVAANRQIRPEDQVQQKESDQVDDDSESSDDCDEWAETIFMPPASFGESTSIHLPTSRYSRQEDTHPFLSSHPSILQELLVEFQSWRQHVDNGRETSTSGSASSANSPSTASARTSPGVQTGAGPRGRKRSAGTNADEDEDEDEPGPGGSKKRNRKPRSPGEFQRRLACPFAKKDPPKYRECYKNRITRIQDVKTHLRRFHEPPIYCPCCKDSSRVKQIYEDMQKQIAAPRATNTLKESIGIRKRSYPSQFLAP
jgi:hypothetical protein